MSPNTPLEAPPPRACVVTGGSRNLGRAICIALARTGADVAFTHRNSAREAEETLGEIRALGGRALAFPGDVTDHSHARHVIDSVVRAWGRLDVLVNNAAVTQLLPIALIEEADWDRVLDVNAKGTFLFCREALKPMLRQRRGAIVNVTTFGDGRVLEAPVHFAASKAAVRGLTEALAREVGHYGVRINCLAPGLAESGLGARVPESRRREYLEQCALGRLASLEELARAVVFLASEEQDFVTGATLVADGGV